MVGMELADVIGHTVIVHDADGNRVSCGVISVEVTASGETMQGTYPDYEGDAVVTGSILFQQLADGGMYISGSLAGLGNSTTGGVHVHEGMTCEDSTTVGGMVELYFLVLH